MHYACYVQWTLHLESKYLWIMRWCLFVTTDPRKYFYLFGIVTFILGNEWQNQENRNLKYTVSIKLFLWPIYISLIPLSLDRFFILFHTLKVYSRRFRKESIIAGARFPLSEGRQQKVQGVPKKRIFEHSFKPLEVLTKSWSCSSGFLSFYETFFFGTTCILARFIIASSGARRKIYVYLLIKKIVGSPQVPLLVKLCVLATSDFR